MDKFGIDFEIGVCYSYCGEIEVMPQYLVIREMACYLWVAGFLFISRSGAAVAHLVHNQKNAGSIPASATRMPVDAREVTRPQEAAQ